MKCPVCGKEIQQDGAEFCTGCGANLKEVRTNTANTVNNTDNINNVYSGEPNNSGKKTNMMIVGGIIGFLLLLLVIVTLFMCFSVAKLIDNKNDQTPSEQEESVFSDPDDYGFDDSDNGYTEPDNDWHSYGNDSGERDADSEVEVMTEPPTEPPTKESTYQVYFEDLTWSEARRKCESMGGHLVTFDTEEEWNKVTNMLSGYGTKYTYYIGAGRVDNDYYWIDGSGDFYGSSINNSSHWLAGEPTFYDSSTGKLEDCVAIFRRANTGWLWNDIPDDYANAAPNAYGKIGYICEFN